MTTEHIFPVTSAQLAAAGIELREPISDDEWEHERLRDDPGILRLIVDAEALHIQIRSGRDSDGAVRWRECAWKAP